MKALRSAAGELAGLFVDDRLFAAVIAVWVAVVALARPLEPHWRAIVLAAGLAVILFFAVVRAARPRSAR